MKVVAELIKEYEGFKQYPYKCPSGYWTIGYGSRYYPGGAEVSENDPSITRQIAEKMLNDYLSKYVLPCIDKLENARAEKRKTKSFKNYSLPAKFTQNQIEALASLIYNIPVKQFEKSKCYAGIVDDDLAAIYKEWDWIYAGGKVQAGLCKRRAAEKDCFFNF